MRKRLYSPVLGALVCLACVRTCSIDIPPDAILGGALYVPLELENDHAEYSFKQKVILNRPLRCSLTPYYVVTDKHLGSLVWQLLADKTANANKGKDCIVIPAGTEIILTRFFAADDSWPLEKTATRNENYFLCAYIPSRPDLQYIPAYFMGHNGTLEPFPWDSEVKLPPPGTFRPLDIEKLFPGGKWEYARKQKMYRASLPKNSIESK
ncbi:MAG: hypothetical protein AB7F32_11365 [Victivallaceae bacterium]